jgi:V-type H+-transporting ATPase subunit d
MSFCTFNLENGYCESLLRGYRSSFLTPEDYKKLAQCENLEDVRSVLEDTEYGNFLQDDQNLSPSLILHRLKQFTADQFAYFMSNASGNLYEFLVFIKKEKMIDNVCFLISGVLNNKSPKELLSRLDPLGYFEELKLIESVDLSGGFEDLYRMILIDSDIGPYFELNNGSSGGAQQLAHQGNLGTLLSETDLEIFRLTLKRNWIEDFHRFCTETVSGNTGNVMGHILKSEADFRTLIISLNSLTSPLGQPQMLSDRNSLFPAMGYLHPEGTDRLKKAFNEGTVRAALDGYGKYLGIFEQVKSFYVTNEGIIGDSGAVTSAKGGSLSLEDVAFKELAGLYELSFEDSFHLGVFYAYFKLKEQETRNIEWITEMIQMGRNTDAMKGIVTVFEPRS